MNVKPWAPASAPETLGGREEVAKHTGVSVFWEKDFHTLPLSGKFWRERLLDQDVHWNSFFSSG